MSLEKIANKQELSKLDIINAAQELSAMEKDAELADAAGREAANELVDELAKEAEDEAAVDAAAEEAAEEILEEEEKGKKETEKKASATPEAEIAAAVEVLKRHNVIK
jgi:hypothetical protein